MKQSLTKEELEKISSHHIRNVDKWHRMMQGIASNAIRYSNNILLLEITGDNVKTPFTQELAEKIASSWFRFNKEFREAEKWTVSFYTSKTPTGIMVSPNDKDAIREALKQWNAEVKEVPVFHSTISGTFTKNHEE